MRLRHAGWLILLAGTVGSAQPPAGSKPDPRLLFIDRFEYVSDRLATSHAAFTAAGWNNAKSHAWARAGGYVYTVTSIPGFTGKFPGGGSHVLALEALPGTFKAQTDFYLQLGNENTPDKIPGDVWLQFWIYPQDFGSQRSLQGTRNKFLYFSNDTYPSHSHKFMISSTATTFNPLNATPFGNPSAAFALTLASADGVSQLNYTGPGANPERSNIIGPQQQSGMLTPNRWWLVKMHFNTGTTSGSWEMWLKPADGQWAKVADYRDGVNGLTWRIPPDQVGGHRMMRMPTTVGSATSQWHDYWLYLDDFAMAAAEAALPVY